MNTATKTILVIAFAIAVVLLMLFGGGAMTGTMMSGGVMGGGHTGKISWMWFPVSLIVAVGAVLFSVRFSKKVGQSARNTHSIER